MAYKNPIDASKGMLEENKFVLHPKYATEDEQRKITQGWIDTIRGNNGIVAPELEKEIKETLKKNYGIEDYEVDPTYEEWLSALQFKRGE